MHIMKTSPSFYKDQFMSNLLSSIPYTPLTLNYCETNH